MTGQEIAIIIQALPWHEIIGAVCAYLGIKGAKKLKDRRDKKAAENPKQEEPS